MSNSTIERYDSDSGLTPLDFVIQLVAKHRDTDELDLPILSQSIDGNLIDRFLRRPPAAGELRFRWDSVTVTLSADRTVEATSIGGEGDTLPSNEEHAESARSPDNGCGPGTEIRVTNE